MQIRQKQREQITKIDFLCGKQEKLLLDAMFEVPGSDVKSVIITEDCVKGLTPPEYIKHSPSDTSESNDESPTTQSTSTEEEENAQVRVKQ